MAAEDKNLIPTRAFPALSDIREPVQKELNRRKTSFGSNNLPSTTWVRMVSNARPSRTNTKRRRENERKDAFILMGAGTLEDGQHRGGFDSIYYSRTGNKENQQLFRPTPGITNVSVTMEGELGSIRQATITWIAPSVYDLEELSPYFLTPGVTAILEWGYGIFQDQITAVGLGSSDNKIATKMTDFFNDPRKLYQRAIDAEGRYDAMLGRVSNFEWSANQDGTFTCTTKLLSMGELMAGLHLEEQLNSTNPNEEIQKSIKEFLSDGINQKIADFNRDEASQKDGIDVIDDNPDDIGTWVSWGFLEDLIINQQMHISNEGKATGVGFFPYQIDSRDSLISNDPVLLSIDENIIINKRSSEALKFDDPDGDVFSGVLRHVYIKTELIIDTFSNSDTFKEAFDKLFNIMNNAASNIWQLRLYVDPLTERLRVIDERYTNDLARTVKPRTTFSFGGFGKETILKNINLVSNVSSQLAVTYMFAKNKDEVEKDKVLNAKNDMGIKTLWGKFDDLVLFKLRQTQGEQSTGQKTTDARDAADNIKKKTLEKESVSPQDLVGAIQDATDVKTISSDKQLSFVVLDANGKKFLKKWLHRKDKSNLRRKQQTFAPLELNVTIDGIGGIIPGNIFRIENIPEVYEANGVFQVIRVEHDISPETWDTKVTAYFKIINFDDTEFSQEFSPKDPEDITAARGDE